MTIAGEIFFFNLLVAQTIRVLSIDEATEIKKS